MAGAAEAVAFVALGAGLGAIATALLLSRRLRAGSPSSPSSPMSAPTGSTASPGSLSHVATRVAMAADSAVDAVVGPPAVAVAGTASAERLTAQWSLGELTRPLVLLRDAAHAPPDLELPAGTRLLLGGGAEARLLRGALEVRRAGELAAELAVDASGRRALLLPGGLRAGGLALSISDAALAARFASVAEAAWAAAPPYVERRAIADLAGEPGLPVEAEGRVAQVLPWATGVLLRLEDGPHSVAVQASSGDGLQGKRVLVQGKLGRGPGGYTVVEAADVRVLE